MRRYYTYDEWRALSDEERENIKRENERRAKTCRDCGGSLKTERVEVREPNSAPDKLVMEWGFEFFPHVDTTLFCEVCGRVHGHSTGPLRDKKTSEL